MISEEDITEAREKEKILTESYYLLKKLKTVEPSKVTKQEETEQINRLRKAIDATKPFAQPTGFSTLVGWHIALLVAGLLLYALAQVLGTPM